MLTVFVKGVHIMLSVIMALYSVAMPGSSTRYGKIKNAEPGCEASFAVISDTHLKDNFIRKGMLELGLYDMSRAKDKLDAVVFDGDITDNGYIEMWDCFADAVGSFDVAKDTVIVTGNHDTWGPDRDNIETVKSTFIEYNKKISGRDITDMYYSTEIGGCPAIVLGSEGDSTSATVSQAQIDWFAAEMEKASRTGKPIFVFFHQPINGTHGLPYTWELDSSQPADKGGIGDRSDDVFDIVKKYDNVFYISGHIHEGFANENSPTSYVSVEKHGSYTLVNLPCYMYMDAVRGGHPANGTGYVFEVYPDKVLIRARNFAVASWVSEFDEVIDLK